MALSAKQKAEMERFVSCLNNLLSIFRYKLEAGQAEAEGDMLLLPVEPGDLNQRWSLGDNGWESILVEQEQPERDHMGPGGYMICAHPRPESPTEDLQVDQPKSARPLQVGDRVITLQNGNNAVRFDFAGQGNKEVCNGSYRSVLTRGLSPAPASSSFSPVKTLLGVWASLPPALQKDAAEDTLRMLVRLYGEENK